MQGMGTQSGKYKQKRFKHIKLTKESCELIQKSIPELKEWRNADNVYKAFHEFLKENKITGSLVSQAHFRDQQLLPRKPRTFHKQANGTCKKSNYKRCLHKFGLSFEQGKSA